MDTVTHREMRNNSAEVLRRVANGESLQISNRGRIVAVISPPTGRSILDDLIAQGLARPATKSLAGLSDIELGRSDIPTSEIIDDLRRPW